MNYLEWKDNQISCPACNWTGCGRETRAGELFADGAEFHCPECGEYFRFILWPTTQETLSSPLADSGERIAALRIEHRWGRFDREKLRGPEQLPTLEADTVVVRWDVHRGDDGEEYIVLASDECEIWRELAWFEGYERFVEIANILQQRYGTRLADIVPTEQSEYYLYGDSMHASSVIESARKSLRESRAAAGG
jgi:DNA-directed RNA polymerase subunit RPC12/RpoP